MSCAVVTGDDLVRGDVRGIVLRVSVLAVGTVGDGVRVRAPMAADRPSLRGFTPVVRYMCLFCASSSARF